MPLGNWQFNFSHSFRATKKIGAPYTAQGALSARLREVQRIGSPFSASASLSATPRIIQRLGLKRGFMSFSGSALVTRNPTVTDPAALSPISRHIASDLSKVTKDGSNVVSAWAPSIGSLNFTQSNPAIRPVWSANVIAGRPGIVFPTPNTIMTGSGGWRVSSASGAWTTMCIAQSLVTTPMDGVDDIQFPVCSVNGPGGARWMWIQDLGTTAVKLWERTNGSPIVQFLLGSRTGPLYCASNKVVCGISGNDPDGSGGFNSAIIRSLNTLNHSGMVSKRNAVSASGSALNETVQLGMPLASYSKSRGEFSLMEIVVWDRQLSPSEVAAMQAYAMVTHGGAINDFIVFIGDSVTYGTLTEPESYPAQLMSDSAFAASDYMNMGHSGQTITQMAAEAATYDLLARPNGLKTVVFMAGLNGGTGENDAAKVAALQSAVTTYKAAGYKVIVCTTTDGGSFDATSYGYIVAFNNWVRANWASTGADDFVDVALDPLLGVPGAHLSATYFADGLHPTTTGNTRLAGLIKPAVQRVQALYA